MELERDHDSNSLEFGFVPLLVYMKLKDTNFSIRAQGILDLEKIVNDIEDFSIYEKYFSYFIEFLCSLLDDPILDISYTTFSILRDLVEKNGKMFKSNLKLLSNKLFLKWGDPKLVIRRASSSVFSVIVKNSVLPEDMAEYLVRSLIKSENWNFKEEMINFIIYCLLKYPNESFNYDGIVKRMLETLKDVRLRVKYVSIETIAVVEHNIGEEILQSLKDLKEENPKQHELLLKRFKSPVLPILSKMPGAVEHKILQTTRKAREKKRINERYSQTVRINHSTTPRLPLISARLRDTCFRRSKRANSAPKVMMMNNTVSVGYPNNVPVVIKSKQVESPVFGNSSNELKFNIQSEINSSERMLKYKHRYKSEENIKGMEKKMHKRYKSDNSLSTLGDGVITSSFKTNEKEKIVEMDDKEIVETENKATISPIKRNEINSIKIEENKPVWLNEIGKISEESIVKANLMRQKMKDLKTSRLKPRNRGDQREIDIISIMQKSRKKKNSNIEIHSPKKKKLEGIKNWFPKNEENEISDEEENENDDKLKYIKSFSKRKLKPLNTSSIPTPQFSLSSENLNYKLNNEPPSPSGSVWSLPTFRFRKNKEKRYYQNIIPLKHVLLQDLQPSKEPNKEFVKAMRGLMSENWELQFHGITSIRRLTKYHKSIIDSSLHHIIQVVSKYANNLRSQLAKNAILCIEELFSNFRRKLDRDLKKIYPILLKRTSIANNFISKEAGKALISMVKNSTENKSLVILLKYCTDKSPSIRITSGMLINECVELMKIKVFKFKDMKSLLLVTVKLLNDRATDARKWGQRICYNFERIFRKSIKSISLEGFLYKYLKEREIREFMDGSKRGEKSVMSRYQQSQKPPRYKRFMGRRRRKLKKKNTKRLSNTNRYRDLSDTLKINKPKGYHSGKPDRN